jgi:putative ABC transport system permease protein
MRSLFQDLRYGLRVMKSQPLFTSVALLTLALGVGANAAVFSVVNAVMIKPLAYPNSDRLVQLSRLDAKSQKLGPRTSALNFSDWRARNKTFESLGGYTDQSAFNLKIEGEPQRLMGARISDSLFPTLGIVPILGRNFLPEEDRQGANRVAILSYKLWQSSFGGDPGIVGRSLQLDGQPHTIVGVMGSNLGFPSPETMLWVPYRELYESGGRGNYFVSVIGKLRPGVSLDQAQVDMTAIANQLSNEHPEVHADGGISLTPLHEQVTGKIRDPLLVLLAAVGLVMLIACANVANLLLTKASTRQREIALRTAIGAARSRIFRQLMVESLLTALGGGLLGLLFAILITRALIYIGPTEVPRLNEISLNGTVLLFTFAISCLTALIFGIVPAIQSSKVNLSEALKEGGRTASGGGSGLRQAFVVAEICLAFVLLIGAGLVLRSFARVLSVDPGFRVDNVLTFEVSLPFAKYDQQKSEEFFQNALTRIGTLPGVQVAGCTTSLPLTKSNNARYFTVEGRTGNSLSDYTIASHRQVSPRYFEALGVGTIKGRSFGEQDLGSPQPIVVVNQEFERTYFPNQDALGKRIKMGETADNDFPWMTVVGVVGNIRHASLETEARPEFYRLISRNRDAYPTMTFAVRTSQSPELIVAGVRREVQQLDPDQPISKVETMQQLVQRSVASRRFSLVLMGSFALLALVLAMIGIYGVISYMVAQNKREIGIRIALGAQGRDVLKLIVGQGMVLILSGVGSGIVVAYALSRLMTSLLFEVKPSDPLTFVGVALILATTALIAIVLPAPRALRVNPVEALRLS